VSCSERGSYAFSCAASLVRLAPRTSRHKALPQFCSPRHSGTRACGWCRGTRICQLRRGRRLSAEPSLNHEYQGPHVERNKLMPRGCVSCGSSPFTSSNGALVSHNCPAGAAESAVSYLGYAVWPRIRFVDLIFGRKNSAFGTSFPRQAVDPRSSRQMQRISASGAVDPRSATRRAAIGRSQTMSRPTSWRCRPSPKRRLRVEERQARGRSKVRLSEAPAGDRGADARRARAASARHDAARSTEEDRGDGCGDGEGRHRERLLGALDRRWRSKRSSRSTRGRAEDAALVRMAAPHHHVADRRDADSVQ
jgi:hypothetical protein